MDTGSVLLECVPDVTVEVVVSAEQQPAALAERHRRDAADDVVVRVHADLLVGAYVEQSARRVVRTGREREPARKELPRRKRKTQTAYSRFPPSRNVGNVRNLLNVRRWRNGQTLRTLREN